MVLRLSLTFGREETVNDDVVVAGVVVVVVG